MDDNGKKYKPEMRLDKSFEMHTLGGQNIVVPHKVKNIDFTNVLTLNETATVIWERMNEGDFEVADLVKSLTDTYDIDEEQARKDVSSMLGTMRKLEMITD